MFLIGVTLTEGAVLVCAFHLHANWLLAALHYAINPPGTPAAWCFAGIIVAIYVAYAALRSPLIRRYALRPDYWGPFAAVRVLAIVMAFVTGYFEELIFRRVLMDHAMAAGYGVVLQILMSAGIFGFVHAIWGLFGGKWRAAMSAMLATGVLGGLLALDYIIGSRSLAPCAAAHIGINLILEPWLILTSASGGWGKMRMAPALDARAG